MFSLTDNGELKRIIAHFRTAPEAMKGDIAEGMRKVTENLIAEQFATGKDPYGKAWLPPKDGHTPPMIRTGTLRDSIKVTVVKGANGLEVSVRSSADYAKWLQNGTWKMKPRLIVPGSLPGHWRDAYRIVFEDALEKWIAKPLRR